MILRALMEWKFDRESKEYIFSMIGVFTFAVMTSMLFTSLHLPHKKMIVGGINNEIT